MSLLNVVHADEHLLVFDKPAGLLAVPGRGPENQDCLSARAQAQYPDALIVHRLDMATSGLVVMARGIEAQRQAAIAIKAAHADAGGRVIGLYSGLAIAGDDGGGALGPPQQR